MMSPDAGNEKFHETERLEPLDTGLRCLTILAAFHGIAADEASLRHTFGNGRAFDDQSILLAGRSLGLTGKRIVQNTERLHLAPLPALAQDKNGRYFILAKVDSARREETAGSGTRHGRVGDITRVLIQRPSESPQVMSFSTFLDNWSGQLTLFASKATFSRETSRFDFTWFIPAIIKYRRLLGEVLVISFVLQLIGLATPLAFQVVMDKVLVNHATKTLHVIVMGFVGATLFEAGLSGIRRYVFAHTSSKIDVELGTRLFSHLLALPVAYFQARRVGDSVARMRELENIRSFLTGNAMTLLLDIVFSFVFLTVMFWYSRELSVIVLASIPVYFIVSLVFTPILRTRLDDKFTKNAENQAFLVETISGIDTVKSLSVEPRWQHKWDGQLAAYVSSGLSSTNISLLASGGITLTSKLVTALIMWLGAELVVSGKLSVGELIAFNMLSNQIASPILRLAQLWNDFQQVGISMSRLGDILNTPTEVAAAKTRLPRLQGAIEFDNVSFRYRLEVPLTIQGFSLKIRAGEVIGIVGRSGSGKSTLTKLLQGLYTPERGRILVDGHDVAMSDRTSLRHQLGVVLQENTLFMRSIRDNIALSNPALPLEHIIEAAKLAGAHDFICALPEGYDTLVGEHGTGLSGGQRQRIAIARALISNPRILIFDEATSALDYESEKIIQDNMRRICQGRTVLIIAHRLSAVRDANRIVVMEQGKIAEIGSHKELLGNHQGIYAHLFGLQHGMAGMETMPKEYQFVEEEST
jgi:subfamily B ATP-binding cassette protein HlyB/CyaB